MRFSGKISLLPSARRRLTIRFSKILMRKWWPPGRLGPSAQFTEGIRNNWLHDLIIQALEEYGDVLIDPLPQSVRERYDLPDLQTALEQVHLPDGRRLHGGRAASSGI